MAEEQSTVNKIDRAVKQEIQPLFKIWCEKAELIELESKMLFLKEFDERNLNEYEQLDELQKEYNYFVDLRTYQNHWRKLKKKIFKILP